MPDAPILGASTAKKVKLDEGIFTARFNESLVHQSVRAEQAARRRGTAATKTRGMVSGGGAKPWRQKGTGRARAGSNRSPIWTGGGTVFGPQPRSYTFKVNRKEQRAALRSALSLHAERGSLAVLDTSVFSAPKTKQAFDLLDDWNQPGSTLVVLAARERRRRRPAGSGFAGGLSAGAGRAHRARCRKDHRARDRRGGEGLMEHSQVILRPVVSEKSYVLSAANRYTFRVHPDAHKTQIRQAVEALFEVNVVEVRTLSVKSKPKRRGGIAGRTRVWKKAIVQIRDGESIPIFQGLQALD
jgi:large subunit ribosomal protein L4